MRSYEAARGYFSFVEFAAWVAILVGVLVALAGGSAVATSSFNTPITGMVLAALPGLALCGFGLFALVNVQSARANVDSAEYAQQSLKLSRDQFEVSKRLLTLTEARNNAAGYEKITEAEELSPVSYDTGETSQSNSAATPGQPMLPSEGRPYNGSVIHKEGEKYRVNHLLYATIADAMAAIDKDVANAKKLYGADAKQFLTSG